MILGLDPAIATLGFALIAGDQVLDLGVWETPADQSIAVRLAELCGDVAVYLAETDARGERVTHVAVEVPSFLRDASASSKLWGSYGVLMGLCFGRVWVPLTTSTWRAELGLAEERSDAPRGADARTKARAAAQAKARRKAANRQLMLERYGRATVMARLETTPHELHQHAIDALAIGTSWADMSKRLTAPAQPSLFNQGG